MIGQVRTLNWKLTFMTHHLQSTLSRRAFLGGSVSLIGALPQARCSILYGADAPSHRVRIGVMGTSRNSIGDDGRGTGLAVQLAAMPGAEIVYVCDVDKRNVGKAIDSVSEHQPQKPKGVSDFRHILDDPSVDALLIAAPDHWHAPAAIAACAAGKHVYVEKPCSHNAQEALWLVAAARKYDRIVQHGTQRRSWPGIREAIEQLHEGIIGRVISGHGCYFNDRVSIGRSQATPVPDWLDWDQWQGPAPRESFRDNVVHYNWHWFWNWGTSEVGNNGVHTIDVLRWGLGVDAPHRVTSSGGRYRYDDDQETPDTNVVSFDCGDRVITWEGRSWGKRAPWSPEYEITFLGEDGMLAIHGGGYTVFDASGKPLSKAGGRGGDQDHLANFLNAIRGDAQLNAEIDEGVKSTLFCHLANIAFRTGGAIDYDGAQRRIRGDDAQATKLWGREYEEGWQPKF
jgi:predicted dehydrogenase